MRGALAGVLAAALLSSTGCGPAQDTGSRGSDTSVLGGYGDRAGDGAAGTALIELGDRKVSPPPAPRNTMARLAGADRDTTVALWVEDGRVMHSRHHPARGWDAPAPLEDITGQASDVALAANGRGDAMAVWRHTVGSIDSLRYSRWNGRAGWSEPDVLPGALPRPRQPGKTAGRAVQEAAPWLELDAAGNARAQWLSGFDEEQVQVSTHVPGEGWARPLDLPLAQAPAAAQARP